MRFVTLFAVVALLAAGANAAPLETSSDQYQKFSSHDPRPYPPSGEAGGEDFATSVDMVALPFNDSGNMWDYADDIDFGYGTSPDCVYHYTPDADGCVTFDLCESNYDSMIFVVDEAMNIIVWNDDGAACDAFQSQISWMYIYAGVKYFYVLDGWGGSAGPYVINVFVRDCPPPPECPEGALLEGEPCQDPYNDLYNAGCNADNYAFGEIECAEGQIVFCGTIFNHYDDQGNGLRDTDWLELVDLFELTTITSTSYYESTGSLYYILVAPDCNGSVTIPAGIHLGSRELGELVYDMDPAEGRWAIFQSKNYYDGTWYTCEDPELWPYVLTIDGYTCPVVPAETETWGGVKNLFK
ncbi:MAG: hypothetical protein KAY32_07940 [Candidatus Eisenbacteria sp.]|nr:hypothetical protein [Candidatus Eisenbacteria bacterium]